MRSLPNKLYPFRQSVLYNMLILVRLVPDYGISCTRLYDKVSKKLDPCEFIAAMTYLYAIGRIELKDNLIYNA